jgi:hypothetical protein
MKDESKQRNWISFRVKPEEYDQINGHFKATTYRKLSEYARNVLLNKPVNVKVRNQSADEILSVLIQLKKELNAIGNNFNQVVHKLHTLDRIPEFRSWVMLHETTRQSVEKKITEIKLRMEEIYRQWLQK